MTTILEEIQETKQVQQEEYLTIDQIMPNWSYMFDIMNMEKIDYRLAAEHMARTGIFMHNYETCAVGEAHKFSNAYHHTRQYYCRECTYFARQIFPDLLTDLEINRKYVGTDWRNDPGVQMFVMHWNIIHKNEVIKSN